MTSRWTWPKKPIVRAAARTETSTRRRVVSARAPSPAEREDEGHDEGGVALGGSGPQADLGEAGDGGHREDGEREAERISSLEAVQRGHAGERERGRR